MLFCPAMMRRAQAFRKQRVSHARPTVVPEIAEWADERVARGGLEPSSRVGWVERSETHQSPQAQTMGFAALYPSYEMSQKSRHVSEQPFRILLRFRRNVPRDLMFYVSSIGGELE
jgi:hypothetical protein